MGEWPRTRGGEEVSRATPPAKLLRAGAWRSRPDRRLWLGTHGHRLRPLGALLRCEAGLHRSLKQHLAKGFGSRTLLRGQLIADDVPYGDGAATMMGARPCPAA